MRVLILAGLMLLLCMDTAAAQRYRRARAGYDDCPACRRAPHSHEYYGPPGPRRHRRFSHEEEFVGDIDGYHAHKRDHDRSRRRLRNLFLGAGAANEIFNKGQSKNLIRAGSLGGAILNEIFNR